MFRTLFIFLCMLFTPFAAFGHSFIASEHSLFQQTGEVEVGISPLAHIYAKRSVISFEVCGGGVLVDASQQAAQQWNSRLIGRVQVRVIQSECADSAEMRNWHSELYYAHPGSLIHRAVGLYRGVLDRQREVIAEEDITVDSDISDLVFLTNIITHELGHALGLNHALNVTCRESVMAEYACSNFPSPPTAADIAAAKTIYTSKQEPIHNFDLNGDGRIDDREFFAALDRWLSKEIGDLTFFDLIDAWISKRTIPTVKSEGFSLLSAERVELYDLSGQLVGVYTGRSLRSVLQRLPRETYLYRAIQNGIVRVGKVVKS